MSPRGGDWPGLVLELGGLGGLAGTAILLWGASTSGLPRYSQIVILVCVMALILCCLYWYRRARQWRWAYRQARDLDRGPVAAGVARRPDDRPPR